MRKFTEGERIFASDLVDGQHYMLLSGEVVQAVRTVKNASFDVKARAWRIPDHGNSVGTPKSISEMWQIRDRGLMAEMHLISPEGVSLAVPAEGVTGPAIRSSGRMKRRDVRDGEAFVFPNTLTKKFVQDTVRPASLPAAWHFVTGFGAYGSHDVELIPRWDAIRTSGKTTRKDVRPGESFIYPDDRSDTTYQPLLTEDRNDVIARLPRGFSIASTGPYSGSFGELAVVLVPGPVFVDTSVRTSGVVKRRDVRPGEAFEYVDKLRADAIKRFKTMDGKFPAEILSGWAYAQPGSVGFDDRDVQLLPGPFAKVPAATVDVDQVVTLPLRTSGETVREDVRLGEAFRYLDQRKGVKGELVLVTGARPGDLPSGWGAAYNPAPDMYHGLKVQLIPHYRSSQEAVKLSTTQRKNVVKGQRYVYISGNGLQEFGDKEHTSYGDAIQKYQDDVVRIVSAQPAPAPEPVLLRKDLNDGDTFYYVDTPTEQIIVAPDRPSDMPSGWKYSSFGGNPSKAVVRIPSYRNTTEIRTSGQVPRNEVRLGETFEKGGFRYVVVDADVASTIQLPYGYDSAVNPHSSKDLVTLLPSPSTIRTSGDMTLREARKGESFQWLYSDGTTGASVFYNQDKRPDDLPKDWSFASVPFTTEMDRKIRLIPGYRAVKAADPSTEIRTSGVVKRKDVRTGETFRYRGSDHQHGGTLYHMRKVPTAFFPGFATASTKSYSTGDADKDVELLPPPPNVAENIGPIGPVYKHGNSGRTYSFVAGKNEYNGERGWKPVDLAVGTGNDPGFDPVAPVMAVHDLMEHFPGDEYAPHNEYMAQGAMLWLRFEGGFFGTNNVAETVVGPAFGMLYHHVLKGSLATKKYDGSLSNRDPMVHMPRDTAFMLQELVAETAKYARRNYSGAKLTRVLDSLAEGVPWMVDGYIKAGQRYAGLDKKRLVRLYQNTVEQIKNVTDGGKLTLTMNYETYSATVELSSSVKVTG